jgi:hypothetical protein
MRSEVRRYSRLQTETLPKYGQQILLPFEYDEQDDDGKGI